MKKVLTAALVPLLILSVLSGCHKTPDSPIVVGKDMTKMLGMAMAAQDMQGSLSIFLASRPRVWRQI